MNVLFLCSANMCRSPMADGYLRKLAADSSLDIQVRSAALYHGDSYPATDGARWTATANEFDLDDHRSQSLTPELVDWADIIFVMTKSHLRDVDKQFGAQAAEKSHLLGKWDPDPDHRYGAYEEIDDPYGGPRETYETVFNRIRRSIDAWLADTT